jgi:hypothetical protein
VTWGGHPGNPNIDRGVGVLLAVPYGLLADRYGRKPMICLSIPGFLSNMVFTAVILGFSNIFPLRMIWLSSITWIFGGGAIVAGALVWTMMADVTTESQRSALSHDSSTQTNTSVEQQYSSNSALLQWVPTSLLLQSVHG